MSETLPFDIGTLLVFGKVVECRSLSRAAALLGMPKSTVSRKINKLESDLGIRLLRKNTHQITVTDLGEKIYSHGLNILTEANHIRALVEGSKQEPQGVLRVAIPVFVGIDFASRVAATFLQRYPKSQLGIRLMLSLCVAGFRQKFTGTAHCASAIEQAAIRQLRSSRRTAQATAKQR
jgi:DNA-binding transcriptional LysR family regulator